MMWNWKNSSHNSSQRMNTSVKHLRDDLYKKKHHGKIIQQFLMIYYNTVIWWWVISICLYHIYMFLQWIPWYSHGTTAFDLTTPHPQISGLVMLVDVTKCLTNITYIMHELNMTYASNWRQFHKVNVIYGMYTPWSPWIRPHPSAQYCNGAFHFKLEVPASNPRYENMGAPLSKVLSHS